MVSFSAATSASAARRTRKLVLLSATIFLLACMALVRVVYTPRAAQSSAAVTETLPYLAKTLGSQLVIYVQGETMPALVTDIDVRGLPQTDRAALARGITLPTDEALAKLLEDYSS